MSSLQNAQVASQKRLLANRPAKKRAGALLEGEARVLELIALDAPLEVSLAALCRLIERYIPLSVAGITVLDRPGQTFQEAFFPSLPPTFAQAIRGVGIARPHIGSCVAAVSLNEIVTCENFRSPNGFDKDWVALCLAHGINAIQSVPACSSDGTVLGTFVVGFPMDATLDYWAPEAMKLAAYLTGVAIEHDCRRKQQEMLVGELRHRIRNVFTVIGSIAQFTFREYPSSAPSLHTFLGRLKALSRAHCLPDDQHDLSTLICAILEPYRADRSIDVAGPDVILSLGAIQAFGLALHELATNAAKYGALSVSKGSLRVDWTIRHEDRSDVFELRWVESGGPEVAMPVKTGFGTAVIERNLANAFDARVSINFAPEGLRCTIAAPLAARLGNFAAVAVSSI